MYIQVIKKDNSYGRLGYKLVWTKDVRLKDEEVNYYTDYLVLNQKGFYIMKVYSKDNPQKVFTSAEFRVGEQGYETFGNFSSNLLIKNSVSFIN